MRNIKIHNWNEYDIGKLKSWSCISYFPSSGFIIKRGPTSTLYNVYLFIYVLSKFSISMVQRKQETYNFTQKKLKKMRRSLQEGLHLNA